MRLSLSGMIFVPLPGVSLPVLAEMGSLLVLLRVPTPCFHSKDFAISAQPSAPSPLTPTAHVKLPSISHITTH